MSPATIMKRIAYRLTVATMRNKTSAFLGLAAVVALGGTALMQSGSGLLPGARVDVAGVQTGLSNADCADTAMAAVADRSEQTAQAAYRCMAPAMRQGISEDEFVTQLISAPRSDSGEARIERVGAYQANSGERIVYFAMTARGQTLGYMVYLDQQGRVAKME